MLGVGLGFAFRAGSSWVWGWAVFRVWLQYVECVVLVRVQVAGVWGSGLQGPTARAEASAVWPCVYLCKLLCCLKARISRRTAWFCCTKSFEPQMTW